MRLRETNSDDDGKSDTGDSSKNICCAPKAQASERFRAEQMGKGMGGGGGGGLTDMLPNFYLFVSLHNGLGSLHGIRTGRATRATHATVNGQRTGDNRKSTMHETATTTTRSAERPISQKVCGRVGVPGCY